MGKYKQKTALITGVAGALGTKLADRLLSKNYKVYGIDNFCSGQRKNSKQLELKYSNFEFSEADAEDAKYLIKSVKPDEIYHAASPASPPVYDAYPFETIRVNTETTHQMLESVKHFSRESMFMFFSTSEVYGDPKQHPQKESYTGDLDNIAIRSLYDNSKRLGETITYEFYRRYKIDVRIPRFFNSYSEAMNPEDGRVITNFVKQAIAGEPLTIYGGGKQTRSICYVEDTVDAIELLRDSSYHKPVNIGNDQELTIMQIASLVYGIVNGLEARTDHSFPKINLPLPAGDPTQRKPDLTLCRTLLGWSAKHSPEEGLTKYIQHIKQTM